MSHPPNQSTLQIKESSQISDKLSMKEILKEGKHYSYPYPILTPIPLPPPQRTPSFLVEEISKPFVMSNSGEDELWQKDHPQLTMSPNVPMTDYDAAKTLINIKESNLNNYEYHKNLKNLNKEFHEIKGWYMQTPVAYYNNKDKKFSLNEDF